MVYIHSHFIGVLLVLVQIDSPAQLASVLVNITDSDEIESEDVSLTVGLLDTVANSTEDVHQKDVSCRYRKYKYKWSCILLFCI